MMTTICFPESYGKLFSNWRPVSLVRKYIDTMHQTQPSIVPGQLKYATSGRRPTLSTKSIPKPVNTKLAPAITRPPVAAFSNPKVWKIVGLTVFEFKLHV